MPTLQRLRQLTVGLPPAITAGTGLDAFAHCVEAFSSPHYHPMSHGIALEGMRLVISRVAVSGAALSHLALSIATCPRMSLTASANHMAN
mgnify:CR=1 FL=1